MSGRRHVALGAEPIGEFAGVAAGDALEFGLRKFGGIADHAALGAAEGNVHHGALPGHPGGESAHFVERDIGRETDAAFARAADRGVQHAVTDEDFEAAVVHRHRQIHGDFLAGILQVAIDAIFETHALSGEFETRLSGFINVQLIL